MNKIDDFFLKILKNTRTSDVNYFIISNMDAIQKALALKTPIKKIYETMLAETDKKISYSAFFRKIKNISRLETNSKVLDFTKEKLTISSPKTHGSFNPPSETLTNEPLIIKSNSKKFEFNNEK